MQVEVAETGPCTRTLTIKVPPERVREHLDQMYASAAQQVHLKGFRKGKVPRPLLEKKYGKEILVEAKEQIVNRCFNDACREQQIVPVGRAAVDSFEQLELTTDRQLEFTVRFDVKPGFSLLDVRGLELDSVDNVANEADVDHALQEIANQKRAIRAVDEPAQEGDFVKVDLRFLDEAGAEVHVRKGVQLNTRIPVAGTDPQAFAQALTGAQKGGSIELPLTFPDNFEKDAFRGKPGKAVLEVHEVLRVTPAPVDDALAKSLDFDNLAALRSDLLARIGQEKIRVGKLRQEEQALEQVLAMHQFELPPSLVEEQTRASLAQFARRLEQNGLAKDDIDKKLEESKGEAGTDAQRRVKLFFLIDAIARQQKLFVTETDVDTEVRNIAQQNQVTPAQVVEHLEKNNQLGELRLGLMERKVRDFLRDSARIVDRKAH